MAVSGDGRTLVVGDTAADNGKGAVRVWYRTFESMKWNLVATMRARAGEINLGETVAVSSDGYTVAYDVMAAGIISQVRVWDITAVETWYPNEQEFSERVASVSNSPKHLVLSGFGDTMAMTMGETNLDGYGPIGGVTVWKRTNNMWARQATLRANGVATVARNVGTSLAISEDGLTLVAGTVVGVSIWRRSSTGVWNEMRLLEGSSQGKYVALSGDGRTLAATGGQEVRVWEYTDKRTWVQKGQTFPQPSKMESFRTLKLSSNGQTLAAGIIRGDNSPDYVRMMRLSGSKWAFNGPNLIATTRPLPQHQFGSVMGLSGDGLTLTVGNEFELNAKGTRSGAVYVFRSSK